jgi:drug/metabolite transporter (DMT)-like permease
VTAAPHSDAGLQDRPLAGIAHTVAGVSALSVMDALAKGAVAILPIAQLMFLRGLLVLLMLLPSLRRAGGLAALRTTRPFGHFLRAALSVASIGMFFEALRHLPLATVIAVGFVAPLFMTALSVPMLGERVGVHRWTAIGVGFAGVMVIVRPGPEGIEWAALLAIGGALGWAVSTVLVRRLARTERDITLLVYQNLGITLAMGAAAPFVWRPMGWDGVVFVVVMALTLAVAQWFQLRALRFAPVGLLAPFQYLELVWATLFGWLIWDEFPAAHVWLGTAIVIASGLYVLWRERRVGAAPARPSPALQP